MYLLSLEGEKLNHYLVINKLQSGRNWCYHYIRQPQCRAEMSSNERIYCCSNAIGFVCHLVTIVHYTHWLHITSIDSHQSTISRDGIYWQRWVWNNRICVTNIYTTIYNFLIILYYPAHLTTNISTFRLFHYLTIWLWYVRKIYSMNVFLFYCIFKASFCGYIYISVFITVLQSKLYKGDLELRFTSPSLEII